MEAVLWEVLLVNGRNVGRSAQLLLMLLVVLATYSFLQSHYFSIQDVRVSGHQYYSTEQLITASGIAVGDNIFACNTRQAVVRLTRLPFIHEARVVRRLPNRIEIQVQEIKPVVMVSVGSQFWGVSDRGVVLGPLPDDYPALPIVTGLDIKELSEGQGQGLAILAARLAVSLPEPLRSRISEIVMENRTDIVLITYDLIRIHLGDEGHLNEKLLVLEAVLADIWEKGVRVRSIHLQRYDNPVIRN